MPRFEALAYVLPLFDPLTDVVIRLFIFQTFAEVCYSAFVKRSSFKRVLNLRKAYIFKSLLKVYYRSVFNESSKAFIFQKFAESLHPEWDFPLIKPSVVPRSKFTDEMWSSASVLPQSKSTELCSYAPVVPQSKSTELCSSASVIPQSITEMWSSAAPFHHWTQFYDIYYLHFITLFLHYISSFLLCV